MSSKLVFIVPGSKHDIGNMDYQIKLEEIISTLG